MEHFEYSPRLVCSQRIEFDMDDDTSVHNIVFYGGCPGNLKAVGKLCEGMTAVEISDKLAGNLCGGKGTSCADQLSIAVTEASKHMTGSANG